MIKNPTNIVYLMILTIPFNIDIGFGITPSRALTVVGIIIFGIVILFYKRKLQKTPLDLPFFLFLLFVLLSFFQSIDITQSFRNYITLISLVIRFYIVINFIQNYQQLKKAVKFYFLSIFLAVIFGILQYADYEFSLNLGLVNTIDLVGGHLRVTSYFLDSNFYANFLIGSIPFILSFLTYIPSKKIKVMLFIIFSLVLINLFLTYSRSALISLIIGLILVIFYLKKHVKIGPIIALSILTTLVFLFFGLTTSVFENYISRIQVWSNDLSILNRFAVFIAGVNIVKDNIFLGIGYENTLYNVVRYADPMYPIYEGSIDVHNLHLKLLAETGILGYSSYILIIKVYLQKLKKIYIGSDSWFSKAIIQGCVGGLFIILVNGFMLSNLLSIESWVVYLGLGMAYYNIRMRERIFSSIQSKTGF